MKRSLWILGALLVLSAPPSVIAGTESHGGAGLTRNGKYVTFYSAGFYTEPTPAADPLVVPGLNELITFINDFPEFSLQSRARLLREIIPTPGRQYFKVDESRFDETTSTRLIDEFARVMKVERPDLKLYAVTDTKTRTTYLLPAFFQITSKFDQMAILFHEAFWILNPNRTYQWIVDAEMAFQAMLEKPTDTLRILEFMKYYSSPADQFQAAINGDRRTRALPRTFSLLEMLGPAYFECLQRSTECQDYALTPLYRFMQKYPQSAVLKLFHVAFSDPFRTRIFRRSDENLMGTLAYLKNKPDSRQFYNFSSCEVRLEFWLPIARTVYGLPMTCEAVTSVGGRLRMDDDYLLVF